MTCRIMPFVPGRRPTDDDIRRGLGSSDCVALVTGESAESTANHAVVLFELPDAPAGTMVHTTLSVDGVAVPGWERRTVDLTDEPWQRVVVHPEVDFATVDLSLAGGLLRRAEVELVAAVDGAEIGRDRVALDVCDMRLLGALYQRILDRIVAPDTARQAAAAGVADPGPAYHPWFPVLTIGGDKAALYTAALVADIVGKDYHLTDPAWLLRVGVYLELITCLGIVEAVREDIGDLLDPQERAAFETAEAFGEIRDRIQPMAWRDVWRQRRITFPGFGTPRLGPVSALNLLRKRDATLAFLHTHHEDLKHAIWLAGPNDFNAQETWQRVYRDAERAVMRQVGTAFPELQFVPAPARELVLWQRLGFAAQQGVYPTACNQYRASMNMVADWAKARGLFDYAGPECVPERASLLDAYVHDRSRVEVLQRQDGLGPDLAVTEPATAAEPTVDEIEQLLAAVPIFTMLDPADVRTLAMGARPLLLGPTQRFVVEGREGTSLFLIGEGEVEVRIRREDGSDWLVETMGAGEVVGEMALLTGDARAATVRSVEQTVVYEIGRDLYEPLIKAHPEWLDQLADVMSERLQRRRHRIQQLSAEPGPSLVDRIRRNFRFG